MPFTISHAAAALPVHYLSRARLPLAALMIGSMSPDFAYFLPLDVDRMDTHSIAGMFYFCLPVGLALWLYFVALLERPTIAFLPDAWRTRLSPTVLTTREIALAAVAIVLGAATHDIWDSFTHSTPVVHALPGFRERVMIGGYRVPMFFILQVLSSVFGLVVLAIWGWNIRRRPEIPRAAQVPPLTPAVGNLERILAAVFVAATACAMGFFRLAGFDGEARRFGLFFLLIGGMTGVALAWSLLAVSVRLRARVLRMLPPGLGRDRRPTD